MTRILPFDGPSTWATVQTKPGYNIEIIPQENGWKPCVKITTSELTYYFVQSADDTGAFTPGYAIPDPAYRVFSMPEDLAVPTWCKAAIERAGFTFDPQPNYEKWRHESVASIDPEQTELVV